MQNRDPLGYYAILEVDLNATSEEIRQSFRRRAKELHPDHNPALAGSQAQFQLLSEAYGVLIDNTKRALYDRRAIKVEQPYLAQTAWRSEHITCAECGKVTPNPRYVVHYSVLSLIVWPRIQKEEGISCRSCADSRGMQANVFTYLCGFWGVGAVPSCYAIFHNLQGGKTPAERNARLLFDQARAFAGFRDQNQAYAIAQDALGFAKKMQKTWFNRSVQAPLGQQLEKELQDFIASLRPTVKKPTRAWSLLRFYVFFQIFILMMLIAFIAMALYFVFFRHI